MARKLKNIMNINNDLGLNINITFIPIKRDSYIIKLRIPHPTSLILLLEIPLS